MILWDFIGFSWDLMILMGFYRIYHLVICSIAIEHDLPNKRVIFDSYVYQRLNIFLDLGQSIDLNPALPSNN